MPARRAAARMRPAISAGDSIRRPIGRVVKVVELGDGGEPCLQHLDIELRGDRLDVVRRHHQRKAIHGLAPGPERVGLPAPDFGEAGHGPLEGVAMQVRRRRRHDGVTLVPFPRCGARSRPRRSRRPRSPPARRTSSRPGSTPLRHEGQAPVASASSRSSSPAAPLAFRRLGLCINGLRREAVERHASNKRHRPSRDGLAQRASCDARAEGRPGVGVIEPGAIAAREGRIAFAGPQRRASRRVARRRARRRLRRPLDYARADRLPHPPRLRGRSGARIRAAGSPAPPMKRSPAKAAAFFRPSARPARASEDELIRSALRRLDALIAEGVGDRRSQIRLRARPCRRAQIAQRRAPARRAAPMSRSARPSLARMRCRRNSPTNATPMSPMSPTKCSRRSRAKA